MRMNMIFVNYTIIERRLILNVCNTTYFPASYSSCPAVIDASMIAQILEN